MNKQMLQDQLKKSMLDRNELRTSVLRMLLSAINYYEIQKGGAGYLATEEDVLSTINAQAKQRRDSILEYEKAQRQDLAEKEKKELEILQEFLPQQLNEEEITKLVKDAILETGAKTITDMGKVMGVLMPKVKNKADGTLVSQIVKNQLTS